MSCGCNKGGYRNRYPDRYDRYPDRYDRYEDSCDCKGSNWGNSYGRKWKYGQERYGGKWYENNYVWAYPPLPAGVDIDEISYSNRVLPGTPAARLTAALGYNQLRVSGQAFAARDARYPYGAYGSFT